jgi:hypothetical protein
VLLKLRPAVWREIVRWSPYVGDEVAFAAEELKRLLAIATRGYVAFLRGRGERVHFTCIAGVREIRHARSIWGACPGWGGAVLEFCCYAGSMAAEGVLSLWYGEGRAG